MPKSEPTPKSGCAIVVATTTALFLHWKSTGSAWAAVLQVLGGVALTLLGGTLLLLGRDSLEQTLLVRLCDDGLAFHFRVHSPRDAIWPSDEGTIVYMSTTDVPVLDFIIVKIVATVAFASGVFITADATPWFASYLDPRMYVLPFAFRWALALLLLLMALRYMERRHKIVEALGLLHRNPLGGLAESGNELITGTLEGGVLDAVRDEVAGRALACVPPRAWAIVVPLTCIGSAVALATFHVLW